MARVPLANTSTHLISPAAGQGGGEYISWAHFDLPSTKMPVGLEVHWFTQKGAGEEIRGKACNNWLGVNQLPRW